MNISALIWCSCVVILEVVIFIFFPLSVLEMNPELYICWASTHHWVRLPLERISFCGLISIPGAFWELQYRVGGCRPSRHACVHLLGVDRLFSLQLVLCPSSHGPPLQWHGVWGKQGGVPRPYSVHYSYFYFSLYIFTMYVEPYAPMLSTLPSPPFSLFLSP